MAISILDTPTTATGTTYSLSPSAGSNRVAFVITTAVRDGAGFELSDPASATLGGQSMTNVASYGIGTTHVNITVWALDDSGIDAMSGSSFSYTPDADSLCDAVTGFVVQGANQTLSVEDSFGEYIQFGGFDVAMSSSINVVAGGINVAMMVFDQTPTSGLQASSPPAITSVDGDGNQHRAHLLYELTAATTTATASAYPDTTVGHMGLNFSFGPAAASGSTPKGGFGGIALNGPFSGPIG